MGPIIWEQAASPHLARDPPSAIVQSYLPGVANLDIHLLHDSLASANDSRSPTQTAAWAVQSFIARQVRQTSYVLHCATPSPEKISSRGGCGTHLRPLTNVKRKKINAPKLPKVFANLQCLPCNNMWMLKQYNMIKSGQGICILSSQ